MRRTNGFDPTFPAIEDKRAAARIMNGLTARRKLVEKLPK